MAVEKPRIAGKKIEVGQALASKRAKRREGYVKENDPHYLPEGWEDDLIEATFRFPECEGGLYTATPLGYLLNIRDGDTVQVPRVIVKLINAECKIWKRDRVQKDPAQPSRWAKSKSKFKRRCYFEILGAI